jgi:hypothetical protein
LSSDLHISNTPLDITQNFKELKDSGLAFIRSHSGYEWTNLNASDPGVTILDQLCYALSELGYCNDFAVKDILTGQDGTLAVKNQFYLPQDILTTSAVTTTDYIKYLVDTVSYIDNAVILQATETIGGKTILVPRTYKPYLYINTPLIDINKICWAAFVSLNKSRNLNELFEIPLPLEAKNVYIHGSIEIQNKWNLADILKDIATAVSTYIFPKIIPEGYTALTENGTKTNDIFNGPSLQNGWIPQEELTTKKDTITIYEVQSVLETVSGVQSVSNLQFVTPTPISDTITSTPEQLIFVDVLTSFSRGLLTVTCNNQDLSAGLTNTVSIALAAPALAYEPTILYNSSVDTQVTLPVGNYRDINCYYSIQNTFPAIYEVGPHSLSSNSAEYQVAQTRQLAGYLTLFDQVLANQFSQLANVDKLFSFQNYSTGTPSDRKKFYAQLNKLKEKGPRFPVPFLQFSPTYFYQSLYEIPYIKPLLKDSDMFNFSSELHPEKIQDEESWKKYKQDPYNTYIRGLTEIMEDEQVNLERRNQILDHLLARHGESPLLINAFIEGSFYTRRILMDKVIFKSLYLQNLGLLSYYRYKAYNFMAARKINSFPLKTLLEWLHDEAINLEDKYTNDDFVDFIFNSRSIDWREKLTENDFINYSGIELKLHLLFGLHVYYRDFFENCKTLEEVVTEPAKLPLNFKEKIKQAMWFIDERKGLLLIEMELLLKDLTTEFFLVSGKNTWKTGPVKYGHLAQIAGKLSLMSTAELQKIATSGSFTISTNLDAFSFEAITKPVEHSYTSTALNSSNFAFYATVINTDADEQQIQLPDIQTALEFIFPYFLSPFNTVQFKSRLTFFLNSELPVNTPYNILTVHSAFLNPIIDSFVLWHNSLIYDDRLLYDVKNDNIGVTSKQHAWNLLLALTKVYTDGNNE